MLQVRLSSPSGFFRVWTALKSVPLVGSRLRKSTRQDDEKANFCFTIIQQSMPIKSKKEAITKPIIKHCLGIDVSKAKLDACFSKMDNCQSINIAGTRQFANSPQGWKALVQWCKRFDKNSEIPFVVVMEATGVYHEGLAYHLNELGMSICVVLPNKSKNYAKSLNIKTKNDLVDAQTLARMGLERKLDEWRPPSDTLLKLKRLTRERNALMEQKTVVGNQLHAHCCEYQADKQTIKRRQQLIAYLDKQIKAVEQQIRQVLEKDPELKGKVENVCTIKGISTLSAVCVIAETNGFELIENKNQLVSYAGYDVVERQSGSSVNGKTRISKKGNSHIRKALFFPALTAIRYEPKMRNLYERILEKNPKVKMIGAVAVQRKLLILIYTLFKTNQPFQSNYEEKRAAA